MCSRSSADGPDDGGAVVAAAAAAVVDGRDERFPSPFNKQGSMVSLVVSRLLPVVQRGVNLFELSCEKVSARLQPATAGHARLVLSKQLEQIYTSLYMASTSSLC